MASLNSCQFIGNLGKDPEVRTLQNGDKVANLSIACSETWKDKDGNKKERTTWVPIVIWGPLAGVAERFLHKGSKVYVSGKFSVRKWQDQNGNDRYSTEIVLQGPQAQMVMLDGKQDGGNGSARQSGGTSGRDGWGQSGGSGGTSASGGFADDLNDEIPF